MSDYDISILNGNDFLITQEYGVHPDDYIPLGLPYHVGIDIVSLSDKDWNIESVNGGVVQYANWREAGYGNVVIILQDDNVLAKYMHLESIFVSVGDYVTIGQEIGVIGNTGNSTGRHLHLEVSKWDGNIWSINNHFDPIPYLNILDDQLKSRKPSQTQFHDLTINNMAILEKIINQIQNEDTSNLSKELKDNILNSFKSGDYGYTVKLLNSAKKELREDIQTKIQNEETSNLSKELKDNILNSFSSGDYGYTTREFNSLENKLDFTEQKLTMQEAQYRQEIGELKLIISRDKLMTDKSLIISEQETPSNKPFYKSKKFWATLIGIITALVGQYYPEQRDTVNQMLLSLSVYVLGQGIADGAKK